MSKPPSSSLDTLAVHAGVARDRFDGAAVTPITRATVHRQTGDVGYDEILYPRLSTLPNQVLLGEAIAALEGAERGLVTASGMAAISTTLLSVLTGGGHLLAQRGLYGGAHSFITEDLPGLGANHSFVDARAPETWAAALRDTTRAIYVESLTNPLLEVADHRAVTRFAHDNGLISIIDNTFATPVLFRPLECGYDIVLHSATKYLNGHSDLVAGAIAGSRERLEPIRHMLGHTGGSLDPGACYLLHRGIKTLALRVRAQCANAARIAEFLEQHDAVASVRYPGLATHPDHVRARELFAESGAMLAFELVGGKPAAEAFVRGVELILHSPSLGGVETLVTRPAATSHAGMSPEQRAALGVSDGLIRMSVGVESAADLIADLERGLAR